MVGTSEIVKTSWPRALCLREHRTLEGGSEFPTPHKLLDRGPLIGRSKAHSMGVGTSDPWWELPTPAELQKKVLKCLSMVITILVKHFGIFKQSFLIPLSSSVFPILKFKVEIHKSLQWSSNTVYLANLALLIALFYFNNF